MITGIQYGCMMSRFCLLGKNAIVAANANVGATGTGGTEDDASIGPGCDYAVRVEEVTQANFDEVLYSNDVESSLPGAGRMRDEGAWN